MSERIDAYETAAMECEALANVRRRYMPSRWWLLARSRASGEIYGYISAAMAMREMAAELREQPDTETKLCVICGKPAVGTCEKTEGFHRV